jgi:hypothetical protein
MDKYSHDIPLAQDNRLQVRLARREELPCWRDLMRRYHYLGFERIVGSALYYVATIEGGAQSKGQSAEPPPGHR